MKDILSDLIPVSSSFVLSKSVLFEAGRSANHIIYTEEGLIKLERITHAGKEVITSIAHAGEYVAVSALFSTVYHCTAVALTDATIRVYPKEAVLSEIKKDAAISLELVKYLSGHVRELREQLTILNIQSAEERIITYLKAKSKHLVYTLPKNLKNVAAQLGLTQETLYRKLKDLEDQHLIERSSKEIRLVNNL